MEKLLYCFAQRNFGGSEIYIDVYNANHISIIIYIKISFVLFLKNMLLAFENRYWERHKKICHNVPDSLSDSFSIINYESIM